MILDLLRSFVDVGNTLVWNTPSAFPWFVALLVGAGIIVTFWMGWIQIRRFRHAVDVARGKYDDPEDEGDINHFQALTTALSATVGIGNIAGVAIAIHWGGPGALFWMWVTAIFGMALKYAECTLSMEYRVFDDRGEAAGGPMYYIERGLGRRFKPMAILFAFLAVVCSFGSGNMNQANTIAEAAFNDLGHIPYWLSGAVAAALVGLVILGGIKRIGAVTSKLAPAMAILYVVGGVTILLLNIGDIPAAVQAIFVGAFKPAAGVGGTGAGVLLMTLVWGIKRGLFSNEAGQGSAPIAHAAAKTGEPVREGVVAMLGPFIDTLVICSVTGLVIVTTGVWQEKESAIAKSGDWSIYQLPESGEYPDSVQGLDEFVGSFDVELGVTEGIVLSAYDGPVDKPVLVDGDLKPFSGTISRDDEGNLTLPDGTSADVRVMGHMFRTGSSLTSWAFRRGLSPLLGKWGSLIVTLSVFLFGLSTAIAWSYYGDRSIQYLLGTRAVLPYRIAYVFFVFLGAQLSLSLVWDYGDLALGCMAVPNLIAVLLLAPKVKRMTDAYFARDHRKTR
jgi:alanine or glycine:cation symporter, AGCS family